MLENIFLGSDPITVALEHSEDVVNLVEDGGYCEQKDSEESILRAKSWHQMSQ